MDKKRQKQGGSVRFLRLIGSKLLLLAQFFLLVFLVLVVVLGFLPRFGFFFRRGLRFLAVSSGSMSPTLPVGSLIYVEPILPEKVKEGDIITFYNSHQALVTHRVTEVIDKKKTVVLSQDRTKEVHQLQWQTKGDANQSPDPDLVGPNQLVGRYRFHLPWLGYLVAFAQTKKGFLLTVILPAAILITWELISLIFYFKRFYQSRYQQK